MLGPGPACCGFAGGAVKPPTLAERYRAATTERERLLVCIDAIDQKAFKRGGPISQVEDVFGKDFEKGTPTQAGAPTWGETWGFVYFRKEPLAAVAGRDASVSSGGRQGWHLAVRYNAAGTIVSYSITDLDKDILGPGI